jgi:hypothetical protein
MPRSQDHDIEDYKSEPYDGRSQMSSARPRLGREIEDEELAEEDMWKSVSDDDVLEELAEDDLAHMEGPDA